jgi:methylenetetrahydrofolate reductase (NADPH)
MKVIEHILAAKGPSFSAEIIPPARGRSVKELIDVVEQLEPIRPRWIDVTAHSSSAEIREEADGTIRRQILKKRPGTIGICGVIQNRFKIDTVAHILCLGFTREETEDALIELNFLGVENMLALRGDSPNYQKTIDRHRSVNKHASDLVAQMAELRKGHYLSHIEQSQPLDFCVGVAGYPEKHFEAPNLKTDIEYLKQKVDAGADYIMTQMFYDNQKFFTFVDECRAAGITVPIIPGMKVLRSSAQLKSIPKTFHVDLPTPLVDEIMASPKHVVEIGRRWAEMQVRELLEKNFFNIHFYVMQDAGTVSDVVKSVT